MQATALLFTGLAAGLIAGTASCTVVQGGLLIGLVTRDRPAPVGWFIVGRLASYACAGALLGLLGSAVQLPPTARAVLLVPAGVAVITYALRLMRHGRTCTPHGHTFRAHEHPAQDVRQRTSCEDPRQRTAASPTASACVVRPSSRGLLSRVGAGAWRGPLLGAATILIPCGVTLGMEMVAVSSGSALGGAAVMAGFVVGTAPAFALLGWVLGRVSRTRLARVAGMVAVVAGLWTIASGLSLGGWLPVPGSPVAAISASVNPPSTRPTGVVNPAVAAAGMESPSLQRVTVWATRGGYRPGIVGARAGVAVDVEFKVVDQGCTSTVTIVGRDVALPATVRLPPQPPGMLRYVCGMGMYTGFIDFR